MPLHNLDVDVLTMPTAGGKTLTYVAVNQSVAGTLSIAASPGNKHKVVGGSLFMSATGTLKFADGVPANLTGTMNIAANQGFVLPTSIIPYFETTIVNTAIAIVTTGGAARGFLVILTEP
jgi:hypothetical protein